MRQKNWKSQHPNSLSEAFELCIEFASTKKRRTAKVLADLMGVEVKTLYRWLSDTSMPMHKIRQFEEFCGVHYVSEYLCIAAGRVVIDIPIGRKAKVEDLAEVHASFSEAITLLSRHYKNGGSIEETISALTNTLNQIAFHRQNVIKRNTPELNLFIGNYNE